MRLDSELPTILLPIETAARELDSKLVMASFLASRGCRVIVGHKETINSIGAASRRVVWQGKDAFSMTRAPDATNHLADRLRVNESAVIFIQDEGGIFPTSGWTELVLAKHRADYIRARRLSRVCAWGDRQKEVLAGHGVAEADVIAVTGSPRFDLCSPRYAWMKNAALGQAAATRRPYILMCTRFTSVAHLEGLSRMFRLRDQAETEDASDRRMSSWQRDGHDFVDFVVLVKEIARIHSEFDVILRPHPSEDVAFYLHAFAPLRNVTVTREGSPLDWIRSAELVIHTNCTTGVEAVLAGRRVLNMLPDSPPRGDLDKEVAKEAGVTARSIQDAVEKAGTLLQRPAATQVWSAAARAVLANLTTNAVPMLANETLKVLREERIDSSRVVLPPRRWLRKTIRRLASGAATQDAYVAAKRGTLDLERIEMVMAEYRPEGGGRSRLRHLTPEYAVIES